jgi:hypothetical protein
VLETVRRTGDQLIGGPLPIGVSTLIDLEPFAIGSCEAGTISVTGSHEGGNWTLVITKPLYRVDDIKVS